MLDCGQTPQSLSTVQRVERGGKVIPPQIRMEVQNVIITTDKLELIEDLARDILDEVAELKAPLLEPCKTDIGDISTVYTPCYIVKPKGVTDN